MPSETSMVTKGKQSSGGGNKIPVTPLRRYARHQTKARGAHKAERNHPRGALAGGCTQPPPRQTQKGETSPSEKDNGLAAVPVNRKSAASIPKPMQSGVEDVFVQARDSQSSGVSPTSEKVPGAGAKPAGGSLGRGSDLEVGEPDLGLVGGSSNLRPSNWPILTFAKVVKEAVGCTPSPGGKGPAKVEAVPAMGER